MTHVYANHAVVSETETEVKIDFQLKAGGKPEAVASIILPPIVAAKLGLLLAPAPVVEGEDQPVAEATKLEPQPKPKRSRKPKAQP